jgi:hypothetical protein
MWRPRALSKSAQVVLEAVRVQGGALEFAATDLQRMPEIVTAAVKHNGLAIKWAWKEAKSSKEVTLTALKQNGDALKFCLKVRIILQIAQYYRMTTILTLFVMFRTW